MNSLEKTLVTTLLIAAIVAPSAGCRATQSSLKSKEGRRIIATKAAPAVYKIARSGLESKAGKKLLGELGKKGVLGLRAESPKILQLSRFGQPRQVESSAKFVRDKVMDRYIAVAEDEASYVNMYGCLPRCDQLRSLNSGVNTVASTMRESYEATGEKNFVAYLDESPSEYIIIIVHNKKGEVFFPNGDRMHLKKMAELVNGRNKKGIFLSCEAKEELPGLPASTVKITFDEALAISDEIVEKLRGNTAWIGHMENNPISTNKGLQLLRGNYLPHKTSDLEDDRVLEQINEIIKSGERNAAVKRKVRLIKIGGAVGAGGGTVGVPVYYYDITLTANNKNQQVSPTSTLLMLGNTTTGKLSPPKLHSLENLRR